MSEFIVSSSWRNYRAIGYVFSREGEETIWLAIRIAVPQFYYGARGRIVTYDEQYQGVGAFATRTATGIRKQQN